MDSPTLQKTLQSQINVAIAKQKFQKAVETAQRYVQKFGPSKDIILIKAKAYLRLNKFKQCLSELQTALRLGANMKDVFVLKIKAYLQLNEPNEAENAFNNLLAQDQELKNIVGLSKTIDLLKDKFKKHQLSEKQQKLLQNMKIWLNKAGAIYSKLKVVNLYPDYRGVIATNRINKKQQIVFVPKSQLITYEMALQNKINKAVIQKKIKLQSPKHTFLSIFLLQLKKTPDIKFRPYIDLLPDNHSCFPINFTKSQLQMLQGSPFLNNIYQKVIDLKKDYELVVKNVLNFQNQYSFKEFCWARMMIGSRIFGLLIGGAKTQVLVPFADMLNHRQPKQTMWNYNQSMNGFIIQSLQDIEVGQQVFDSYGRKCNARFLLNYGFIIEDNPDNQIPLKIVLDDECFDSKIKRMMIKQDPNEIYTEIKKVGYSLTNNKFYELMGCLRFICVSEQQTLIMLKKISNIVNTNQPYLMIRTPPLSVKNQILVWTRLGQMCRQQLSKYPHTVEQDQQLSKNANKLTQNEKNIINFRLGQKKLLLHHIRISQEVLNILKSDNIIQELEKKIKQNYAKYLYKILSLTPGINKKLLQAKLSQYFTTEEIVQQETEQVPQS